MNPKARKFKVKRCAICNFAFSDEHHVYPRRRGGSVTIALCPNHHRAANMIQVMAEDAVMNGSNFKQIVEFSSKYFDEKFNGFVWKLIQGFSDEEAALAEKMMQ